MSLAEQLDAVETRTRGRLGVAALNLLDGRTVEHRPGEVFPTASAIKLPILMELARQVAAGALAWSTRVPFDPANRAQGSGIVRDLDESLELTVRDWATLMIALSDNSATNQCIDVVGGTDPVNRALGEWGCTATKLHRKVTFEAEPLTPYFGTGTPRDFALLVQGVARFELVGAQAGSDVLDILRLQQHLEVVSRAFPPRQLGSVSFYSKGGWIWGLRTEATLVRGEKLDYVVAVFAESSDHRLSIESLPARAVSAVHRLLWRNWRA